MSEILTPGQCVDTSSIADLEVVYGYRSPHKEDTDMLLDLKGAIIKRPDDIDYLLGLATELCQGGVDPSEVQMVFDNAGIRAYWSIDFDR